MSVQEGYLEQRANAYEGMIAYGSIPNIVVTKNVKIQGAITTLENGLKHDTHKVIPGQLVGMDYDAGAIPFGLSPWYDCQPFFRNSSTTTPVNPYGIVTRGVTGESVDSGEVSYVNNDSVGVLVQGYIWIKPDTPIIAGTPMWSTYQRTGSIAGANLAGSLGTFRNEQLANRSIRLFNYIPLLNSIQGELNIVQVSLFNQTLVFRDDQNVIPYPSEVAVGGGGGD